MPNTTTFVTYSFIIRIVSGIGAATTSTASLTLLSQTFQDNIAPAMVRLPHLHERIHLALLWRRDSSFWNQGL